MLQLAITHVINTLAIMHKQVKRAWAGVDIDGVDEVDGQTKEEEKRWRMEYSKQGRAFLVKGPDQTFEVARTSAFGKRCPNGT